MIKKNKADILMERFLLLTLFSMLVEMSVDLQIYSFISPYKIFLLGLLITTPFSLNDRNKRKQFIENIIYSIKSHKYILITILLYYIFDLISLKWTRDIYFSLKKYITIIPIATLLPYFFDYLSSNLNKEIRKKHLMKVFMTLGGAAVFLSVFSWLIFITFNKTFYILQISLQADYNQFVTTIALGYLIGIIPISFAENKNRNKYYLYYSILIIPILYGAGSRRTTLALPFIIIASLLPFIANIYKGKNYKNDLIKLAKTFLLILVISFLIIKAYTFVSQANYNALKIDAEEKGKPMISAMEDTDNKDFLKDFRLERNLSELNHSITDGKAFTARRMLWDIADEAIKRFNTKEILIGKGGSYQRDIYNDMPAYIEYAKYKLKPAPKFKHPHSMLRLEILNGGLIKLSLSLIFVLLIIINTLKILKKNFNIGIMLLAYGGLFLAGQFIDSYYGILQNRLTWTFLFLLFGSKEFINGKSKG